MTSFITSIASPIATDRHVVDSVDISPSLRSPREATVAALWKRLEEVGVVHVRGTPASGKSTLAHLLENYVRKTGLDIRVYRFSWPAAFPDGFWSGTPYHQLLNWILRRPVDIPDDWWEMRVLLIIDEAQGSYEYLSVWNDFIKGISSDSGPLVALFSSYGSPSGKPLETPTPTPIIFTHAQRVSIRHSPQNPDLALFFTRAEFDDVVERVCKRYGEHGQAFILAQELRDYIWEFTGGHPAGVRTLLDGLSCSEVSID